MTILEVLGKFMKILEVPIAGEIFLRNDTMKILGVPWKLMKFLEVPGNFCSEMSKYLLLLNV